MHLDKINQKIILVLQKDARITNQELADRVNLSPSSCLSRVRKLEESGVIDAYRAEINLPKVCRSVTVIATVSLKDQSTEAFRLFKDAADVIPEIVECYTVSGVFDFFLRIVAPDMPRYNEINDKLLDLLPGQVNISSHVVLETGKPYQGYPLSELIE